MATFYIANTQANVDDYALAYQKHTRSPHFEDLMKTLGHTLVLALLATRGTNRHFQPARAKSH